MRKGKILGIDYGLKRVGLAVTDPDQVIIFPRETLINNVHLLPDLIKLCADEGILKVVFGVPLTIDGNDTGQSTINRKFADKFERESGLEIAFQDEAYTTFEAEQILGDRKDTTKDSISAMKILEHYLKKV